MEDYSLSLSGIAAALGESPDTFLAQFVEQAEGEETPKPVASEVATERLKAYVEGLKARVSETEKRKGIRERMLQVEAEVKAAYGIPATEKKELIPLIAAIVEKHKAAADDAQRKLEEVTSKGIKASDLKGLSEEEAKAFIANHPFHAQALDAIKAEVAKREEIFEAFKQQIETEKVTGVVNTRALELLDDVYRPKLSDKPEINKRMKDAFLRELREMATFKLSENGIKALDAQGEPLKNSNYIEMTFDQLVLSLAPNYFEQHPVDPNKSAPGASNGKTASAGVVIPDWSKMNRDDIVPTVLKEADPGKRDELRKSATAFLDSNPAFGG